VTLWQWLCGLHDPKNAPITSNPFAGCLFLDQCRWSDYFICFRRDKILLNSSNSLTRKLNVTTIKGCKSCVHYLLQGHWLCPKLPATMIFWFTHIWLAELEKMQLKHIPSKTMVFLRSKFVEFKPTQSSSGLHDRSPLPICANHKEVPDGCKLLGALPTSQWTKPKKCECIGYSDLTLRLIVPAPRAWSEILLCI
jgi:hypothetical protein